LESVREQHINTDLCSLNPEESYINLLKQHNGLWCIDESCHCFVMFDFSVELNVLQVCNTKCNTKWNSIGSNIVLYKVSRVIYFYI